METFPETFSNILDLGNKKVSLTHVFFPKHKII